MNQAKEGALNEQTRILQVQQLLQVILQTNLSYIRIFFCLFRSSLTNGSLLTWAQGYLESYGYLSQP